MKRLATVALGLATAIPLCAQRAAGHASFASHGGSFSRPAPAFHGNFAPSAPMRYRSAPVSRTPYAYRPAPPMPRFAAPSPRYMTVAPSARRPGFYQNQNHHPYSNNHHAFIRTYPVSVVGYLPPDLIDPDFLAPDEPYSDDSASAQPVPPQPDYANNSYPGNGYPDNGYPEPAPDNDSPYPPYPPYPQQQSQPDQEQPAPVAPRMQYVPGSADTVTLIFKDGRPPEQIQNYIATRKTLTVITGSRHREIPIADLDVPATVKANRETGVGFQLPNTTP